MYLLSIRFELNIQTLLDKDVVVMNEKPGKEYI